MKITAINNSSPQFKGAAGLGGVLASAANINSWQQRAALGVAAMTMQPCIDMMNKDVDEETRKISAVRSVAKGFVGAATGIAIRGGCMKAVQKVLEKDTAAQKLAKFTASDKTQEAFEKSLKFIKENDGAKKYASVIGTLVALGVMIFTNFLVDAPLTNVITNVIDEKFSNKKKQENASSKASGGKE